MNDLDVIAERLAWLGIDREQLERIAAALPPARRGVTPGGMEWRSRGNVRLPHD